MSYNPVPKLTNGNATFDNDLNVSGISTFDAGIKTPLNTAADGATVTFDMDVSNNHSVTLGGNRALAVSNVDAGQKFTLRLKQDGTGSRVVTWWSGITWFTSAGAAPTLKTDPNTVDYIGFICTSGGYYEGFHLTENSSGGGGGSSSITVRESDGTPNVSNVSTIIVSNGTLTDDGSGQVTISTGGGGGGGSYDDTYVSGVSTFASGLAIQNQTDIATVSGLLYDDAAISGYFESRVDSADSSITANSGYFESRVDTNAADIITVSGLTGGGSSLTVQDVDGSPSVSNVTTIRVTNGSLTDNGGGTVTIATSGGGGGGGGTTYTAGSGLSLVGTEFNVYGGSGNFRYAELTASDEVPTFKYLGSGVTDTPINLEVRSSLQSATGSGTALLFQGTQGQLFSITDNLSSGTIFNVSDITGLPMLEITASGDVEIGEFADTITVHQPILLSGGVPTDTTNKLYNDAGTLKFNGSAIGGGGGGLPYSSGDYYLNSINTVSGLIPPNTFNITAGDGTNYTIDGMGLNSASDPTMYIHKGHTYVFNKTFSGHPFAVSATDGGSVYSDADGNAIEIGSSAGSVTFEVPQDAPDKLYYYCTAHPSTMKGVIYTTTDGATSGYFETRVDQNAADIITVSGLTGGGGGGGTTYTAGSGLTLVGTEFNTAGSGNFTQLTFDDEKIQIGKNSAVILSGIVMPAGRLPSGIAIGRNAEANNYYSEYMLGASYGYANEQTYKDNTISIGFNSGKNSRLGNSISIGTRACFENNTYTSGEFFGGHTIYDGVNNCIAIGLNAFSHYDKGTLHTEINDVIAIGTDAMAHATRAVSRTLAIGKQACSGTFYSDNNVAIGTLSFTAGSGSNNTCVGAQAGKGLFGTYNCFYGFRAGESFCTRGVGIGYNALYQSDGDSNIGIGLSALYRATTSSSYSSSESVAIGVSACQEASGARNIAIGRMSFNNAIGSYNIGIGERSLNQASGSHNIELLTEKAGVSIIGTNSNKIHIENTIIGDTSGNLLAIGSVSSGNLTPDATLEILPRLATDTGLIVQGATSQSATLQEWQNSSETKLLAVGPDGGLEIPNNVPATTTNKLYNDGGTLTFNGSAVGGGGGGSTYTAGSGLTLAGTEFNVYGGSGNFENIDLTTDAAVVPKMVFTGSGVTDTPIRMKVLSSHASASTSGTALAFEGTEGQLFGITDNLSSGRIFSVNDITGLPLISVDASGDVELAEFGRDIIAHKAITLQSGVPSVTTNKLYNDGYGLYFNGSAVGGGGGGGGGGTVQGTDGTYDIQPADEGATAGNTRGESSVDLQTQRSAATQVASGGCSTISGGENNTASGSQSTIGGGTGSTASGTWSTVGGGYQNNSSNSSATIGGGFLNTASGNASTVGGGSRNTASGYRSTAGGGFYSCASGSYSTVGGGRSNTASGNYSTVGGGCSNTASGTCSTVTGGSSNYTNARHSIVSGHSNVIVSPTNECCSRGATISGGIGHNSSGGTIDATTGDVSGTITCCNAGKFSTIGGGCRNIGTGAGSVIGGGKTNTSSGNYTTVGGGLSNTSSGQYTTVAGGYLNVASGSFAVAAGRANTASGACSVVAGGNGNTSSGNKSAALGGSGNTASGTNSTVSGGYNNTASGTCSTVGGGRGNKATGSFSVVAGGGFAGTTYENCAVSSASVVSGGTGNCVSVAGACNSTVSGGFLNKIETCFSNIGGGCCNTICATGFNQINTIAGGGRNYVGSYGGTVSGGELNCVTGAFGGTIGGGTWNTSSASHATITGGCFNNASGSHSTVGGGRINTASGSYSTVTGGQQGKATRYGETSHAAGQFAAAGDAQHTVLVARKSTTDATANQVMFLDNSSARLTIPAETTWMFTIKLAAHNDTNNDGGWWYFRGGIARDGAGNTSLIGSVTSEYSVDSNISTATAEVVADDTNDALEIRVTGVASKNIRWVAVADISQVSWGTP